MAEFDPDAYVKKLKADQPFDPDAYVKKLKDGDKPADEGILSHVGKTISNIPGSAVRMGQAMALPFTEGYKKATTGESEFYDTLYKLGIKGTGKAIWEQYKERYGGWENIKKTLEEDPVGFLADVSTPFSLGGGALARAPGVVGRAGEALSAVGRATDPLVLASKAAAAPVKGAAKLLGPLQGTGEALSTAERVGFEGTPAARQAFREEITGRVPEEQVVREAQGAIANLRGKYDADYAAEVAKLKQPALPVDDVRKAMYMTQTLDAKARAFQKQVIDQVDFWKSMAAKHHTAEGLDALRDHIELLAKNQKLTADGETVLNQARKAIDDVIAKGDPAYDKLKQARNAARTKVDEIEEKLALDPNAKIGPALSRLKKLLTSGGTRSDKAAAEFLSKNGAPHLIERLAGQALHGYAPAGFAGRLWKWLAAGAAAGAGAGPMLGVGATAMLKAAPGVAAGLAAGSPHLMGNLMYGAGRARGAFEKAAPYATGEYQAGRVMQNLNPREMVRNNASDALRDRAQYGFSDDEIKKLRAASVKGASSAALHQADQIMKAHERPKPEQKPSELSPRPYRPLQMTITPDPARYGGIQ